MKPIKHDMHTIHTHECICKVVDTCMHAKAVHCGCMCVCVYVMYACVFMHACMQKLCVFLCMHACMYFSCVYILYKRSWIYINHGRKAHGFESNDCVLKDLIRRSSKKTE